MSAVTAHSLWWHGKDGEKVRVTFSEKSQDICPILHIAIDDVQEDDLDGLPVAWKMGKRHVRVACLPCGHCFHASALALSFSVSRMRCPVCRQGVDDTLDETCVPGHVRAPLSSRCSRAATASPLTLNFTIDPALVERDWMLMAHFTSTDPVNGNEVMGVVPTHMQVVEEQTNSPESRRLHEFRLQMYFERHLRMYVNRFRHSPNASMVFMLYHPHVDASIESNRISIDELGDFVSTGLVPDAGMTLRSDDLVVGHLHVDARPHCLRAAGLTLPRMVASLNRDILSQISLAGLNQNVQTHVQHVMMMMPLA